MIRWVLNLVSVLSLLLLVAALALWVRGYWATDHFWLVYRDAGAELVRSSRGRLTVRHVVPNVRGIPVPRRLSHWSVAPGSQLAPRPSPLHWEGGVLVYEGTPAPTPQEIAGARVTLVQVEAERQAAAATAFTPAAPTTPMRPSDQDRAAELWILAQQAAERQRLKAESAGQIVDGTHYQEWTFPAWLAAAVTAVLPGATFFVPAYRRRVRLRRGQCANCGYDVRASKDRCPECGSAITSQNGSAAAAAGAAALTTSHSAATSPR